MSTTREDPEPAAKPSSDAASPSRSQRLIGLGLALVSGVAMAVQGRINGALGHRLHDALFAPVLSFGSGLVVLLVLSLTVPSMRTGVRGLVTGLRSGSVRPWQCLGGLAGALFVLGQSVTVPLLGVAMFTVGVVAGQTVSGLFVDKAGLGPSGYQAPSVARVVGAVLMVVAVAGSVLGDLAVPGHAGQLWMLALPLIAGAGMAVQQAVNGRIGVATGSSLTAGLVNFTVGTVALVLAWLVSFALRGGPRAWPNEPVLYLGGVVGIVFIVTAALVVKWTGVLLLGLASIAGQLIGSVLLDAFLPAVDAHLATSTIIGTAVALLATVIASVGGKLRRRPALRE